MAIPRVIDPVVVPAAGPPSCLPDKGWIVTRSSDVRAVLADHSYVVPAARAGGPAGSIGWLRASVSRFTEGPEHARRRAEVEAELACLSPGILRAEAEKRAHAIIDGAGSTGRIEVMASLARRVPMAVLAATLGIADADRAAEAVIVAAAAYFPGADPAAERAADLSTAELVEMLRPASEEAVIAKISVMVQGCDATAGLIGKTVCWALPPVATQDPGWPTDAILAEVARYDPPLRVSRRMSRAGAHLTGRPVPKGSAVFLHVDSANRDPDMFQAPEEFDPGRADSPGLTFGHGLRPCPGKAHALALAAGVVQALRDRCATVIGQVEYEPPLNLRIPARLEVSLR